MTSYMFEIGEKARKASRFIGHVRAELQRALVAEKASRKLTQQKLADALGVNRSVINRQLMGTENLTLRSVAELGWALGWEPHFEMRKKTPRGNHVPQTGSAGRVEATPAPPQAGGNVTLGKIGQLAA
jgi:nucleoid DNA-binding protein